MIERLSLTVKLETVTPLFLGGADSRGDPELRAPSFRGALRYWLRAALGGVIGDQNLDGLRKLESAVFGSTEYGSPIHIRISGDPTSSNKPILPHKTGRAAGGRKAFDAGQPFTLTMRQLRTDDRAVWRSACTALNLAITFGGIGLRSRRGYGTLRVVDSSNDSLVQETPSGMNNWREHISKVATDAIASARSLAQSQQMELAALPAGPARFPCATESGAIRLCDLRKRTAMDAVIQFMRLVPKNQALGDISPRQSSPLWIRPVELDQGYGLLLVVIASQLKAGTNYAFVQKFLDHDFPGADILVKGWNQ